MLVSACRWIGTDRCIGLKNFLLLRGCQCICHVIGLKTTWCDGKVDARSVALEYLAGGLRGIGQSSCVPKLAAVLEDVQEEL